MKINTSKIQNEMKRTGLTLEGLGKKMSPPIGRRAMWYIIHNAKHIARINAIAEALEMDPKDLLI